MKLVVPCAGQGKRLKTELPKPLVNIAGLSMVERVIHDWMNVVDGFIFIVNPNNEALVKERLWDIPSSEFVTQDEPKGLSNAILQVESLLEGRFVVTLGDCIYRGVFESRGADFGIGVWRTNQARETAKNYQVWTNSHTGLVEKVIEKCMPPLRPEFFNCGMGVYFFDERVFKYLHNHTGTPGGGDLTYVIQEMIDAGEKVYPIWFEGEYVNVNYPEDIAKASSLFHSDI